MKEIILLFFITILFACSHSQNDSHSAEKQSDGKEIKAPNICDVDVADGGQIKTDKGSLITIPENAFVDAEGNLVKGKVQIHFEEFHDFADIALSGISMFYDSAGVRSDLRSAGMFTIQGSQDGSEVKIKKGKSIGVDLASIEDTPCYNFYKQEENGQWNYLHTDNGIAQDSLIENKLPRNPENQDLSNIISIDIDYSDIPELNMYRSLIWRTVEDELPNAFTRIKWRTGKIIPVEGQELTFELKLNQGSKNYALKIQPILSGKDLIKAIAKYQSDISKLQSDPNSVYYKTKVIRSVRIDDFGTYNWDVKNKRDSDQVSFPMLAKVDGKTFDDMRISLIAATENIVVNYNQNTLKEFSFDPKSKNILIAFYDGGKIAMLPASKFAALTKENGKKEYITVDLKSQSKKDLSSKDLKSMICDFIRA